MLVRMKQRHPHHALIALTICMLASCEAPMPASGMPASDASLRSRSFDWRVPAAMHTKGTIDGIPSYGVPIRLAGHEVWLSSFMLSKERSFFRDSDPFAEGGLAGRAAAQRQTPAASMLLTNDVRWHNALFVDRSSDEQWPLVSGRAFVSRWYLIVDNTELGPSIRAMVFAVTLDDTNRDGSLDDTDAAVAILTRGDGRDAKIVTPREAQLNGVRWDPKKGYLSFELRFDEDKDRAYERTDRLRQHFLEITKTGLARDETARPWHSRDAEQGLEGIYR